jgi:hypothetical protein
MVIRIQIQGFIVFDYFDKRFEVIELLIKAMKEGNLIVGDENETVVETTFEDIPRTWMMLFEGKNQGKLLTKLK